jgi:ribosomal protein S18 acetylase RimI-like enzyme
VHLVTLDQSLPPTAVAVQRWIADLSAGGVTVVRTGALGPTGREGYLEAGFTVRQELALLHHDLARRSRAIDLTGRDRLRRPRRDDLVHLARLDRRAFDATWAMDLVGIVDACEATPNYRLRVAADGDLPVGYAVSGRAGRATYLQRLAVDPAHQGRALGRALVVDALNWARRHRATGMLVNTHVGNEPALGLYRSLGFVEQGYRLAVLEWSRP